MHMSFHTRGALSDTVTLDEYLIPSKESSYMLKVKGNSMKDAGIVDGDMIIVERTSSARAGDIVVADIDGEHTLKYYRERTGGGGRSAEIYLEPANSTMQPMYPKEYLNIEAVVRAVFRKY
jgi:repressor LexA